MIIIIKIIIIVIMNNIINEKFKYKIVYIYRG